MAQLHCCKFCDTICVVDGTFAWNECAACPVCRKAFLRRRFVQMRMLFSYLFTLVGMVLIVPALFAPMVRIIDPQGETSMGLVIAVQELYAREEFLLATVLGVCSGVLPCVKFVLLGVLHTRLLPIPLARHVHDFLETARWGMLDVYGTAVTLIVYQASAVFEITSGPGLVPFCAMVICNIAATITFDPAIYRNERSVPV